MRQKLPLLLNLLLTLWKLLLYLWLTIVTSTTSGASLHPPAARNH